jgi:hypothetical protein
MEALMKLTGLICATLLAAQPTTLLAAGTPQSEGAQALRMAADRIEADYIDADKAKAIASRLRAEANALRRRPKADEVLAEDVTKLLRSLSQDEHFGFRYSANPMPADIFAQKSPVDTEAAASRTARMNNFGILKVERLPGNIGFIDIDAFAAPERMRKPLAAAMELLRYCDAMIIDLRFNGGGHARGAALAASYFLPEAPQRLLVRFETRDAKETLEIRTEGALEAPRFLEKPVYILTGPGTFSAAEFFASVMQQAGRARVIGVKTRGGVHPSERIRLTPHFGMMLPTTRGVTPNKASTERGGVTPDEPSTPAEALVKARKTALSALIAARPQDPFAEDWKKALGDLEARPIGAAGNAGSAK